MSSSIYFSIDYRSPASGLGQIVDPQAPQEVDGKYNMILVDTYPKNNEYPYQVDPNYVESKLILTEDDWLNGDELQELHDYLASKGVKEVYDSELSYDFPDQFDERGHTSLDNWIKIIGSLTCHWLVG